MFVCQHFPPQNVGDSILCAAWFFHFPGLHCFSLAALQVMMMMMMMMMMILIMMMMMIMTLQGVTMFFLSEYSDQQLVSALADTRVPNVVLYPWQV